MAAGGGSGGGGDDMARFEHLSPIAPAGEPEVPFNLCFMSHSVVCLRCILLLCEPTSAIARGRCLKLLCL